MVFGLRQQKITTSKGDESLGRKINGGLKMDLAKELYYSIYYILLLILLLLLIIIIIYYIIYYIIL